MPSKDKISKKSNMSADVYNLKGQVMKKITLDQEIFNVNVNPSLFSQMVRIYQTNLRSGTRNAKTRSQVKGSTHKIYRQKGTGRARHGDIKAPIFVGGGVAHGPKPYDYRLDLPKKVRKLALFGALTQKYNEGKIKVISGLDKIAPKTRKMVEVLNNLKYNKASDRFQKNILLITPQINRNILLSARNIEGVGLLEVHKINPYEIFLFNNILFMEESVPILAGHFIKNPEGLNKEKDVKPSRELNEEVKVKDKNVKVVKSPKKVEKKAKKAETAKSKIKKTVKPKASSKRIKRTKTK